MDEIISGVRRIREEYVAKHKYDLNEMFADLKIKEATFNR
jgi:hypothetical protein